MPRPLSSTASEQHHSHGLNGACVTVIGSRPLRRQIRSGLRDGESAASAETGKFSFPLNHCSMSPAPAARRGTSSQPLRPQTAACRLPLPGRAVPSRGATSPASASAPGPVRRATPAVARPSEIPRRLPDRAAPGTPPPARSAAPAAGRAPGAPPGHSWRVGRCRPAPRTAPARASSFTARPRRGTGAGNSMSRFFVKSWVRWKLAR